MRLPKTFPVRGIETPATADSFTKSLLVIVISNFASAMLAEQEQVWEKMNRFETKASQLAGLLVSLVNQLTCLDGYTFLQTSLGPSF